MKTRQIPLLTAAIAALLIPISSSANPIADNPVFKLFAGDWKGEGNLVGADGHKSSVKETWTGKFTETGNFIMSGKRTLNESEHDFAWEYYANGDLIEGQMKMSEPKVDNRFEVVVSEPDRSVSMKIPMGSDGTIMTIVNTVSKDGKKIHGTVSIKDPSGAETTTGTVDHEKQE